VTPVDVEQAREEQLEAMKVTPSNTGISEYVRVLAHDPKTLKERTPLFNGIMYSHGGLSRAETELSAVATSVFNRCIYCTAVHASRYNELTKDQTVMDEIFRSGVDAAIDSRQCAIVRFVTGLSKCPPEARKEDMKALVEAGLAPAEILDVVLSASLFGWANRLMHTLGDPMPRE
jgi:uncharacterized peroxidase-related enzyme